MNKLEIKIAIRTIGLALNASHNTVTTDMPDIEPNETSWLIDHKKELALLDELEEAIFSSDICPVCGNRNICP